jgi:hypothetical protein
LLAIAESGGKQLGRRQQNGRAERFSVSGDPMTAVDAKLVSN